MKYSVVVAAYLFFSINVAHSSERKSALGFGFQYGGAFGWQGSIVEGRHRASIGFGLIGSSIGYDYRLGNKISIGTTVFAFSSIFVNIYGTGIRMHYYPNETFMNGWAFGIGLYRSNSSSPFSALRVDEDEATIAPFFSIGYGYK